MSAYGIPETDIGRVLGIDPKTLRKHYREELDTGAIKANSKMAENLYRKAMGDGSQAVAATIFWLKTRAGWRETSVQEHRIDARSIHELSDQELMQIAARGLPPASASRKRDESQSYRTYDSGFSGYQRLTGAADMGRPKHQPTPLFRRQAEAMSAYGIPEKDIARVLGMDAKTLRKHYRDELDTGATKATAKVAEFLYRKATTEGPQCVTAAIFWMKTRGG